MSALPQPVPSEEPELQPTPQGEVAGNEPVFFPVSKTKFILLSIASFGIYEVFWFYKNWQIMRDRDGMQVRPFWRAIFFPIWCFEFFKIVHERATGSGVSSSINAVGLGIGVIALNAMARLPDPFWLISFLSFVPLLPVLSVVSDVNHQAAPFADKNDALSGKNLALLLIGGTLVILASIGAFIPGE